MVRTIAGKGAPTVRLDQTVGVYPTTPGAYCGMVIPHARPRQAVDIQPLGAVTASPNASNALVAVKVAHTIAWAFFVACILAIPLASWRGEHAAAAWLAAIVFIDVAALLLNGWRCPLTSLAARFTDDRRDNFDIYLPQWLARHNKLIFGTLYVAGLAFALARWAWPTH